MKLHYLSLFVVLLLSVAMMQAPLPAQDQSTMELKIDLALKKCVAGDAPGFWNNVQQMAGLGEDAAEILIQKSDSTTDPWQALGLANALSLLGEHSNAADVMLRVLTDPKSPAPAVELSVRSLASVAKHLRRIKDVTEALAALEASSADPFVKIAVAEAQYEISSDGAAKTKLKAYLESTDINIKYAAALALAEMGDTQSTESILRDMAKEPSERGTAAAKILRLEEVMAEVMDGMSNDENVRVIRALQDKLTRMEEQNGDLRNRLADAEKGIGVKEKAGPPLLDQMIMMIQKLYIDDDERITTEKLINAAAKGMVRSLDPHSAYYDVEDMAKFEEGLNQKYQGIGVYVEQRPNDGAFIVTQPIYSGPAYRAGLKSGDIITKVNGESIHGLDMQDIIKLIKGPENTSVKVHIYREGWPEEREFEITREAIVVKDTLYEMLPGNVGYVKQTTFGEDTSKNVKAALEDLQKQGMKTLIYDLRANSGGFLEEAVKIAGFFLGKEKLVVEVRSRIKAEEERHVTYTNQITDVPMVVLVDGNSASASEALGGALRDHERAVLIGTKTFGKGSVQRLFRISSADDQGRLRLTFAKYYLPSGETPHEVGIEPEIHVEPLRLPYWTVPEMDKVEANQSDIKYVNESLAANPTLMEQIAVTDHGKTDMYPGFDAFYKSLDTKLDPDHVRLLIRRYVRRVVSDKKGERFITDLQEDVQLQKAVSLALSKINLNSKDFPEYKEFAAESK